MKKLIIMLVVLLTSQFAGAEPTFSEMQEQAQREGWTFHFGPAIQRATGLIHPDSKVKAAMPHLSMLRAEVEVPDSYDLRGKISPIRNQGNCGSCWSFALTSQLLDAYLLAGKIVPALSEQYLVDCDTQNYGCNGGYFNAARLFVTPQGAPTLASYPYTARNGRCRVSKPVADIVTYTMLGTGGAGPSPLEIQKAVIVFNQPLAITMAAGVSPFPNYKSGIFNRCSATAQTDHMVDVVGWNNEGAQFNAKGYLPPGKGYWIVRNSWGAEFGEQGFFRIRMTDASGRRCNSIAEEASVLTINAPVPPPPVGKEFSVEGTTVAVSGKLKPEAKYDVDTAKKVVGDAVKELDRLNP